MPENVSQFHCELPSVQLTERYKNVLRRMIIVITYSKFVT